MNKSRTKKVGHPPHEPTDKQRAEVSALISFGITQQNIASYLGIDPKTLREYYRDELDTGITRTNAAMARRLFKAGMEEGSVPAMIFWMKVRAGWSEKTLVDVTHSISTPPTELARALIGAPE